MMSDVYGKLPLSVELLLEKRRLELTLRNDLVEEVKDSASAYEIVFTPTFSSYDGIGIDLFRIANQLSNHLLLSYRGGRIRMKMNKEEPEWLNSLVALRKLAIGATLQPEASLRKTSNSVEIAGFL